jgi:regulator of sirC expression with transglutaminase-like and TPR domain/predicted aspartyl protease
MVGTGVAVPGLRIVAGSLLALGLSGAAGAEDCRLRQAASIGVTLAPDGAILIPAEVNGHSTSLILDTGAFWSVIGPQLAEGLPRRQSSVYEIGAGGQPMRTVVTVPTLKLGTLPPIADVQFFVKPPGPEAFPGNAAANLLSWADLEIDLANDRINLFSHDHCPGKVLYWPHSDDFEVPMHVGREKLLTIPVELDGHRLTALLDTGATISVLHDDVALSVFGIDADSPGSESLGSGVTLDGARMTLFRHRFGSLSIGSVRFRNPWLTIGTDKGAPHGAGRAEGGSTSDLVIGMHQLRNLHLFLAYGEGMLYGTTVAGDQTAGGAVADARPAHRPDTMDLRDAGDHIAKAYQSLGAADYDAAIREFDAAIVIAPGEPKLWQARGAARLSKRQYREAIDDETEAIRLDPGAGGSFYDRALAEDGMALRAAALDDCGKALAAAPRDTRVLELRAHVEGEIGQWQAALADLDRVVSADPKNPSALLARGMVKQHLGDAAGGAADLAAARRLAPAK